MASKKVDAIFSPMPVRALTDQNLSGADFRVLGVISYFHRFGKNGSGCYACQQTIAEWTGLRIPTVSSSMKKLRELNYLVKKRQKNRKRMQYFVVHDTKQSLQKLSNDSKDYTQSGSGPDSILTESVCESSSNEHPASPIGSANDELITAKTSANAATNICSETNEEYSVKTAFGEGDSPEGACSRLPGSCPDMLAQLLNKVADRTLKLEDLPYNEGKLRGLAAMLERHAKQSGPTIDMLILAKALVDAYEIHHDDLVGTGHLWRIMEDINKSVNAKIKRSSASG